MKKLLVAVSLVLFSLTTYVDARDTYIKGYTKRDGTRVEGHYRSSPDRYKNNNYSTYGNTNPYTGKSGTRTYGGTCTAYLNC
jgi:hypothetical protein